MINLNDKYDIVIIDSGVNLEHPLLKGKPILGFGVCVQDGILRVLDDFQDYYGHGTAVYSIISKSAVNSKILNIKVINQDDGSLTCDELIKTLQFIYDYIDCNLINLSMGVRSSLYICELRSICIKLKEKDVTLVSAFDNEGCISYPAAFDCVVGVETNNRLKRAECFEIVKRSIVNIRGKGGRQKLPWYNPTFVLFGGNSIACAHVTAIIYSLVSHQKVEFEKLIEMLEEKAISIIEMPIVSKKVYPSNKFDIRRASIFPFNKEMHALIRFNESLTFNIVSVHDVKYSGKVGSSCQRLISVDGDEELPIQNVTQIPWENIDTLILGHCEELNQIIESDIRYEIICEAIAHHVNIFSFDPLNVYSLLDEQQGIRIYWPQLTGMDVPYENFNKLYHIDKPVISIMGTSSQQGKYTLQNMLRQLFEDSLYKVGCISTEPNGYLLGMDYTFPLGYQALLDVTEHQKIQIVNKMVHELCGKKDVILVAGQANSIPFSSYVLDMFPVKQNAFLLGLQSDLLVLCINPYDGIEYVHYTIQYLEGISQCSVCGLVLFPMAYYQDWRGMYGAKKRMLTESVEECCANYEKALEIPCYSLFNRESIVALFNNLIIELSETEE